jgi:ribonuclease P/MRP protein subunit RPP40
LTSSVSKLSEKILKDRIASFLESNSLLSSEQFGFRSRRSTLLQLLTVSHEWYEHLKSNRSLDVIFFDFKKAFDTVNHKLLAKKLNDIGVDGYAHRWIVSFLSNRRQRVIVETRSSEWTSVVSGVPQGSVLGPILFLIFINDLIPTVTQGTCSKLFADDFKLYGSQAALLQSSIDNAAVWSRRWRLLFNQQKLEHLHVSTLKDPFAPEFILEGNAIRQVDHVKDLGIITSNRLNNYDKHIGHIVIKASKRAGAILR